METQAGALMIDLDLHCIMRVSLEPFIQRSDKQMLKRAKYFTFIDPQMTKEVNKTIFLLMKL